MLPVKQAQPEKRGMFSFTDPKPATPKGTVEADLDNAEKKRTMDLWLQAKKHKIPIYFYDEVPKWLHQRQPMKLAVAQLALVDREKTPFPPKETYGRYDRKSWLHFWVELIKKPITQKVSGGWNKGGMEGGKRMLDTLFSFQDALPSFSAAFHNAKHSKDAAFIITFMRKNKLKDFTALLNWLRDKWESKR